MPPMVLCTNGGSTWTQSTIGGINYANEGFVSFTGSRVGSTTRLYGVTWTQAAFKVAGIQDLNTIGAGDSDYRGIYSVDIGQANWTSRASTMWGTGSTLNLVA